MKSIFVDWSKSSESGWEFVGANLMSNKAEEKLQNCPHGNKDNYSCQDCEIYPDDIYSDNCPMYNYAYPLECHSHELDDHKILSICEKTSCTVVYHPEHGYCLSLSGAGMDFSQSIAYAYMIAYALPGEELGCIDWDLLDDVYISNPLSVGKGIYYKILNELKRQYEIKISNANNRLDKIKELLK